jgi:two-component system, LytTR family, response regulator
VNRQLQVLIVDDEPPARRLVRSLLATMPDVEIAGEAASGVEAVTAIAELAPDIVLLDVQMPELDGFGVIATVQPERMPAVVFVTAYDRYALKAFEVHAVDYLLKPFDNDRFAIAVQRAIDRVRTGGAGERSAQLEALLRQIASSRGIPEMVVLKTEGRHVLVDARSIELIEAADKTVRVQAGGRAYVVREAMNAMERRLDPRMFLRVHRSTIVNITRIGEIQPWFQGDYVLILRDGKRVMSGRAYRNTVRALLNERAL